MPSNHNPSAYQIKLSAEAEDDIRDILQYTYENWGEKQLATYQGILDKTLSTLQQNPNIGHTRADLNRNYRVLPAGHHFLVYRVSDKVIYVIRVLHESMDFKRQL